MLRIIEACRICGGKELHSVFLLKDQSMTGVFPKSRDQPVTKGSMELVKCVAQGGCGLVQLRESYDLSEMYGLNYGYRSGLNASMVRHLHDKVRKILAMGVLKPGDLVIDIGSNDSTTLQAYPRGEYELIGIDPTGIKFADWYPDHIRLVPEFFSAQAVTSAAGNRKAKVITSFSMYYDLENPTQFAREIEASLADDGIWIFEQSYLPAMLRTNSFDTICHEHLEFYALKQIMWIAEHAGLKILDVEFNDINGGSSSIVATKSASSLVPNAEKIASILADERSLGLDGVQVFQAFRERVEQARTDLLKFLNDARNGGKVVNGIGASTKGNVLLQYFGIDSNLLPRIGEVNPDKFGAFTPGTLIPLVPEDEVLASNPDYLFVLPWHFRNFFVNNPKFKGRKLVFPLPRLEIVET